jgi:hypothetical protein
VQRQNALLRGILYRDKAHVGSVRRLADCFAIILLAFTIRHHELGRDEFYRKAWVHEPRGLVVSSRTRLQPNQTRWGDAADARQQDSSAALLSTRRYSATKLSALIPNLLKGKFNVAKPNKAWVTDITYVRTWQGLASPGWHTVSM